MLVRETQCGLGRRTRNVVLSYQQIRTAVLLFLRGTERYVVAGESRLDVAVRRNGETCPRVFVSIFFTEYPCVLLDTVPIKDRVSPFLFIPRRHYVKETRSSCPGFGHSRLLDGPEDFAKWWSFQHDGCDRGQRSRTDAYAADGAAEVDEVKLGSVTRQIDTAKSSGVRQRD